MIVLFGAVLLLFIGYNSYVVVEYGFLSSISASAYKIQPKWLFTGFIWLMALELMFLGHTMLMYFAGAFIMCSGAAGWGLSHDDVTEDDIHVIGATGGIILGFVSMILDFHFWELAALQGVFTIYASSKLSKIKNPTYWIEVLAFVLIMVGLGYERL